MSSSSLSYLRRRALSSCTARPWEPCRCQSPGASSANWGSCRAGAPRGASRRARPGAWPSRGFGSQRPRIKLRPTAEELIRLKQAARDWYLLQNRIIKQFDPELKRSPSKSPKSAFSSFQFTSMMTPWATTTRSNMKDFINHYRKHVKFTTSEQFDYILPLKLEWTDNNTVTLSQNRQIHTTLCTAIFAFVYILPKLVQSWVVLRSVDLRCTLLNQLPLFTLSGACKHEGLKETSYVSRT